ncbi:MAG: universal stress protein [Hahellaceae bacterium]|nr:universal stress protein [Hahellaceae bacterium]
MDIKNDWKKLLVVVDEKTDRVNLLERTRCLASKLKASVVLFQACYSTALQNAYLFDTAAQESARQGYLQHCEKALEVLAGELRQHGIDVAVSAIWAKPAHEAIVAQANALGVDLIIKETHYHSLISRAILTNTDWHLIRESAKPLWFIRNREWSSHLSLAAAVDPMHLHARKGELDERLIDIAHELACCLPAELHVIHAFEPVPTGIMAEFDAIAADYNVYRQQAKVKHQTAMDELIRGRVESSAIVHFEEGAPEKVLPKITMEQNIDLLIMGGVSRSGVERIFVGNVAESVLDHVHSDVLIVP